MALKAMDTVARVAGSGMPPTRRRLLPTAEPVNCEAGPYDLQNRRHDLKLSEPGNALVRVDASAQAH